MTPEFVISVARDAMFTCLLVVGPPMGAALVVGLLVSIFQTVTQISEMTLTFIPKILAVFASIIILGPFMLDTLTEFAVRIFSSLPDLVR